MVQEYSTELSDVVKFWYGNYLEHYENIYIFRKTISDGFFY